MREINVYFGHNLSRIRSPLAVRAGLGTTGNFNAMSTTNLCAALARWGIHAAPDAVRMAKEVPDCAQALADLRAELESGAQCDPGAWQGTQAAISLAWDAVLERLVAGSPSPDWLHKLPQFDGEVISSGEAIERAAWDYGKVRNRMPAAVLRPEHTRDVAAAVRFCMKEGISLSPRGFAHSAGGQMQVHNGLVVDMKSMQRVVAMGEDWCEVEAGAGWDVVLRAAMDRGLTPPIVTDWLKVSVGGTLSMGGFGFMSFWRGTQMDHVLELEVVTGKGEVMRCSASQNAALFRAVMGTHGKCGIITRARIPLEPAPDSVRLVQACYPDVSSMYTDFERHTQHQSTDLIHAFAAERSRSSIVTRMNSTEALSFAPEDVGRLLSDQSSRWVFNLELVDFIGGPHAGRHPLVKVDELQCAPGLAEAWEMDWVSFCFRVPPLVLEEQFRGAAPHPELCAWVPMNEQGVSLLQAEFERMDPLADVGNGPVLFFPLRTETVGAPFFRLPDSEHCLFWGMLRRAEPGTRSRIAELMGANEALFGRIRSIGGERYLPDTPPDTEEFWRTHFGEQWTDLSAARDEWDPQRVFGGSFGPFS